MKNAIIALLAIVIIVGGGYWLMHHSPTPTPSFVVQTSTSTPATDETASWKTYSNDEYGFSLKYPEYKSGSGAVIVSQQNEGRLFISIYTTPTPSIPTLHIGFSDNSTVSKGVNPQPVTINSNKGTRFIVYTEFGDARVVYEFFLPSISKYIWFEDDEDLSNSVRKEIVTNSMFEKIIGTLTITVPPNVDYNGKVGPSDTETYIGTDFTFQYSGVLITDKSQTKGTGYIPACNPDEDTLVACAMIPHSQFPNTNFESASFSVHNPAVNSEAACFTIGYPGKETTPVTLSGVNFRTFVVSDAATQHYTNGHNYRAFHNGKCYELSTRVNTDAYGAFASGTIQEFLPAQVIQTTQELYTMVQSFKFTK